MSSIFISLLKQDSLTKLHLTNKIQIDLPKSNFGKLNCIANSGNKEVRTDGKEKHSHTRTFKTRWLGR